MNIVHYTRDLDIGGAGQALGRLHRAMLEAGCQSQVRCLGDQTETAEQTNHLSVAPGWTARIKRRVQRPWTQRLNDDAKATSNYSIFSDRESPRLVAGSYANLEEVDIVMLNWVAQFIDLPNLFRATVETPIVWRLPDLNPLTGGCHYSNGCAKMLQGCRNCPLLLHQRSQARIAENWEVRRSWFDSLADHRLSFVAQSRWVASLLANHPFLKRFQRTVITNGIDKDRFVPMDRLQARERFAQQMRSVPFSAGHRVGLLFAKSGDRRIASDSLWRALGAQARQSTSSTADSKEETKLTLIIVGSVTGLDTPADGSVTSIEVGDTRVLVIPRQPRHQLPHLYAVADALLFPHLEDNCPNTVLESQACGRPVLGFNHTGVGELINSHAGGLLFDPGDFDQMATAFRTDPRLATEVAPIAFPANQLADSVQGTDSVACQYIDYFELILSRFSIG